MHIVKFEVASTNKEEQINATLIIETKRGDAWSRDEARDVVGGTADAKGELILRPNQRLVIETRQEEEPMFDRAQFATVDRKQQQSEGGADVPQPIGDKVPQNIQQSDERMRKVHEQSKVGNASPGFAPRSADANKMDKTYSDKKSGEYDAGTMTGGPPPSGMPNADKGDTKPTGAGTARPSATPASPSGLKPDAKK
jgi:hypothetical protein